METNETRFIHFMLGKGRVTAAVRKGAGNTVAIGAAFCSPNDQFSRKRGRKIAEGRLDKGKVFHFLNVSTDTSLYEQVIRAFDRAAKLKVRELPQWAK